MQEKIVELLFYLIYELKANRGLNEIDVNRLMGAGYTQSEISTAFSWLLEHLSKGRTVLENSENNDISSFRILNDVEKMIIEKEAYGYLIQCLQLGLLNNADVEAILSRIVASGISFVGLEEMKTIVAGYIFDPEIGNNQMLSGFNETIH